MENLQTFLDQMKIEMANQTRDIISQIDEKLAPLKREIEDLKCRGIEQSEPRCRRGTPIRSLYTSPPVVYNRHNYYYLTCIFNNLWFLELDIVLSIEFYIVKSYEVRGYIRSGMKS
ncbi:unnamed protein product [Leptidea sinapis]|uniref:Uncharacterized protein n=1 Tax=Leptidea sinapis TaxID=189913 RepID=A0A5E4PUA0_9NEOP|nr:unnamed protein product [Leptidea sinapis]